MKMMEVLSLMTQGQIKDRSVLEIDDGYGVVYKYHFSEKLQMFLADENNVFPKNIFEFNIAFLNTDAVLKDPPESQKYYLKLFNGDESSYVHYRYDKETDSIDYLIGAKASINNYHVTISGKEIDGDKLLTFIAKHGFKQEIEK